MLTKHVRLMPVQCCRRCTNLKPLLGPCVVFAGMGEIMIYISISSHNQFRISGFRVGRKSIDLLSIVFFSFYDHLLASTDSIIVFYVFSMRR